MINQLRIIGGDLRSRRVPFAAVPGLRPTPARVRETLFNWLRAEIRGARCLDLFAGSGALGFEAVSRGAAALTQVDSSHTVCTTLRRNAVTFGLTQVQVIHSDVLRLLRQPPVQTYDVVFLDPPFHREFVTAVCQALEAMGWLNPTAHIYVEAETHWNAAAVPPLWQLYREGVAGAVAFRLYRRTSPSMEAECPPV